MSSRRKRLNSNRKIAPSFVPCFPSYYPQFGYNPALYQNPSVNYAGYTYDPSNYIYHPVDRFGQVVGPPTRFPPIANNPYYEPYLFADSISTESNHGSRMNSPRKTQVSRHEPYFHLPAPEPEPPVRRPRERSTHESLPPIRRNPFASTQLMLPNDDELRFAVRDLTERDSIMSALSQTDAVRSIKHHDRLQKNYS